MFTTENFTHGQPTSSHCTRFDLLVDGDGHEDEMFTKSGYQKKKNSESQHGRLYRPSHTGGATSPTSLIGFSGRNTLRTCIFRRPCHARTHRRWRQGRGERTWSWMYRCGLHADRRMDMDSDEHAHATWKPHTLASIKEQAYTHSHASEHAHQDKNTNKTALACTVGNPVV